MYWIKRKKDQIKRLMYFLPIIWKGYDFDYMYAIDLFKAQLSRIADFLESDKAFSGRADHDAKRIRTAIQLMDMVYTDKYLHAWADLIEKKYGESRIDLVATDDPKFSEMRVTFIDKNYSEEELKKIAKEEADLIHECHKKSEKAHDLLWRFIGHNIRSWWD